MTYTELSLTERVQIATARLKQYESEHFQNALNRAAVAALPDADASRDEALTECDRNLAALEIAADTVRAEIAALSA